ncbi:MAG: ATP-binding cassette domain-containing protein [Candidatus Harrisonbacteria bacterium]|nr:ATP-binding cassette domain-containing protein [Candidatus Harrisonbacteria bacterium]
MIAFHNVTKSYNGKPVLENVSFKISPGEFVSLTGPSGAGKSTIVKLLIGEDRPQKGRVIFGPYEVNKLEPEEMPALRKKVGVVFQDFKLLPTKTSYENVAFALEVEGRAQWEIEELVPQMLDLVGLADNQSYFPHELSGGMKQRVAIARAMIHRPSVVVADEPTGNLDHENAEDIINLLLKINEELGATVILATHSRDIVNKLKRRVVTLKGGKLINDAEHGHYIL